MLFGLVFVDFFNELYVKSAFVTLGAFLSLSGLLTSDEAVITRKNGIIT